jgi:hypothetical protein
MFSYKWLRPSSTFILLCTRYYSMRMSHARKERENKNLIAT